MATVIKVAPPKIADDSASPVDSILPDRAKELLAVLNTSLEKMSPIVDSATKMIFDVGQLLLKTCVTLNGGGLVAFPAFYKALAPSGAVASKVFLKACTAFAVGIGFAGFACVSAFIAVAVAQRMVVQLPLLPALQAQKRLMPETVDKRFNRRLRSAERAERLANPISILNLVLIGCLGSLSISFFIVGGLRAQQAISALVKLPH